MQDHLRQMLTVVRELDTLARSFDVKDLRVAVGELSDRQGRFWVNTSRHQTRLSSTLQRWNHKETSML